VTPELAAVLAGLGFTGAFVSGLVGVGGAIVMIPLLYYVPPLLGVGSLDIKAVSGITMVQVMVATGVGAWTHGRRGEVHRAMAWTGGIAMGVAAFAGAVFSRYASTHTLLGVFALMTTAALPLMLVPPSRLPGTEAPFDRRAAIAYPAVIGFMSGLVGAGGAFLTVPVLIALIRVPVRLAIGTSLAMTSLAAVLGALGKVVTAQVPFGPAGAVVLGSLVGARAGAGLSGRVPTDWLRAILFVLIALVTVRVWADVLGY
jgi:uncharacterized membrane protein YfcA